MNGFIKLGNEKYDLQSENKKFIGLIGDTHSANKRGKAEYSR